MQLNREVKVIQIPVNRIDCKWHCAEDWVPVVKTEHLQSLTKLNMKEDVKATLSIDIGITQHPCTRKETSDIQFTQ